MASPRRKVQGITRTEILVGLLMAAVVIALFYPSFAEARFKGRMLWSSNNCRQIHIATMSMANDGESAKNPALAWPGDLKARGVIRNLPDFATVLVRGGYLLPRDLCVFGDDGYPKYKGTLTSGSNGVLMPPFLEDNSQYKLMLAKAEDPGNTVFMETKNYTYNTDLNAPRAKPFGDKGFVVCRKGGDVSIYKKQLAHDLKQIGKLPGGGTVESAGNCLNP